MLKKPEIAVVGMACRFPGAFSPGRFVENIRKRRSFVVEVPEDRWIGAPEEMVAAGWRPDYAYSRRACLIQNFQFDPNGFKLDGDLLAGLDPLHQITLATGKEAFETCRTEAVDRGKIGVILAAIALPTDGSSAVTRKLFTPAVAKRFIQGDLAPKIDPIKKTEALAAKVVGFPAALLSMELGLSGGAYTLDAACASSSYAVKLACDELISRRADMMLTGGVSRPDCLYTQVGFSQLKALSPSGRCAPFDAGADGLVVGEGAGILVLKRLEDALAHGDTIYGIIRGIGLSNDMRGNLLAPDSEGQVRAMRAAYAAAGWSPADVDYIECHGTGTPTGDAVELQSLCELWGKSGWEEGQCAIGSVKSMIGHLLTAASAAGLIKTLLAMEHGFLPPSLNFSRPQADSPLNGSPFRVQTAAEPWPQRENRATKRAAVSAFGFGGINAHLLIESLPSDTGSEDSGRGYSVSHGERKEDLPPAPSPVAIVGMETMVGTLNSLVEFKEAVFNGRTAIQPRPERRWKGLDEIGAAFSDRSPLPGAYLDAFDIQVGEFQIPPNEIGDILPQQLLMLKVAAGALKDAGLPLRENRTGMGAVIGINFDFEATNFHLRWALSRQMKRRRLKKVSSGPSINHQPDNQPSMPPAEFLKTACGPPLNASRTLGALGGIVASRIARELRLGGPSFVVSAEESSGVKALEIGVRALRQKELETVLVGGIDLGGDLRSILIHERLTPFSQKRKVTPFDKAADGTLPGEGAVALVLKRLDKAIEDGDRIYAVIGGIGSAAKDNPSWDKSDPSTYSRSLTHAARDADLSLGTIDYIETSGSAVFEKDAAEITALNGAFASKKNPASPPLLGALSPVIGHTGAAAGLFSVAKSALSIFHQIIPPFLNYSHPGHAALLQEKFHLPRFAHYWIRNRCDGPRRALVAVMTAEGGCDHVILEEADAPQSESLHLKIEQERRRPLGLTSCGLFVVQGEGPEDLTAELAALETQVNRADVDEPVKLEGIARAWARTRKFDPGAALTLALAAKEKHHLLRWIEQARVKIRDNLSARISGPGGIAYNAAPPAERGELAFVYPGSGNHYLGMGRMAGLHWPEILQRMDLATDRLKDQMLPNYFVPTRADWPMDWENESLAKIAENALTMIFGQVVHGGLMTRLVEKFGIFAQAVIGYSLGQTAGYFATGAWPERGEMLGRMQGNALFTTQLAGPCHSVRNVWEIDPTAEFQWKVAVVNRSAEQVQKVIAPYPHIRLLIINTPVECVIGGERRQIRAAIEKLACDAVYLEGVVTVHCEAVEPVAQAYHDLHLFPTRPPENIRYYSCAAGAAHDLNRESAAASIFEQARKGFDFTRTIRSAYADGVRLFVELGPNASCSRMIRTTLADEPHLAESICQRGEDDYFTVLKLLGNLCAHGVPIDLEQLYGDRAYPPHVGRTDSKPVGRTVPVIFGGHNLGKALSELVYKIKNEIPSAPKPQPVSVDAPLESVAPAPPPHETSLAPSAQPVRAPIYEIVPETFSETAVVESSDTPAARMIETFTETQLAAARTHDQFLDFSMELQRSMGRALMLQATLTSRIESAGGPVDVQPDRPTAPVQKPISVCQSLPVAYSREMCLEFAVGSAQRVLGPRFAKVDTYPARVRLPDEPLMLVDRILTVEGEKGSLTGGKVVTEHDVLKGAWYLDGDRAPVCISVEAGQADLFLCAYLGIDLKVKGLRTYRLLDAVVTFHRGLPRPGDTIRYEIHIDKFIRQQETYLFFFRFEGYIGDTHLITMTDGCAGFFTPKEVENSGGIVLTPAETARAEGKRPPNWKPLTPMVTESYADHQVEALRQGDLHTCFGSDFENKALSENLHLPGGRMRLIHRVTTLEPTGGRFGLGRIVAEADIHPEDWFLTCHFVDDKVMPGTLMYECCAHALRIFLQRMGWITAKPGVCYEPKIGVPARLKCRGPVTPVTEKVHYEIIVKEIGYGPEPYAVADANMYADGRHIVFFEGMSLKLSGVNQKEIEAVWHSENASEISQPLFTRRHILEFATGRPSLAFGEPYGVFDRDRVIARLPGPPFCFIDRITRIAPEPWVLKPDGWVEAQVDIAADDWYFAADRSGIMPFSVLLEIALQPCGWLAAFAGSALRSRRDLKFRNLGGSGVIHRNIYPQEQTLTMRTRMTKVSEAGEMIIENFDFEVRHENEPVYTGDTYFGFFTQSALADQKGLPQKELCPMDGSTQTEHLENKGLLPITPPYAPEEVKHLKDGAGSVSGLSLPGKALLMVDRIAAFLPGGGPAGLGYIRGEKRVDPKEWFFKAHFYQDPVCPGSLGIESFLQLLKFYAKRQWKDLIRSHCFELVPQSTHVWIYRGQIIPSNQLVVIEATINKIETEPEPTIYADGWVSVDGLTIYKMENFGVRLVRRG